MSENLRLRVDVAELGWVRGWVEGGSWGVVYDDGGHYDGRGGGRFWRAVDPRENFWLVTCDRTAAPPRPRACARRPAAAGGRDERSTRGGHGPRPRSTRYPVGRPTDQLLYGCYSGAAAAAAATGPPLLPLVLRRTHVAAAVVVAVTDSRTRKHVI